MLSWGRILKFPRRRRVDIREMSLSLLRIKGEASALKLALEIHQCYERLDMEAKAAHFDFLVTELGPCEENLVRATSAYSEAPSPENYTRLLDAVEPQRRELIRILNWTPGGTPALVRMRTDLLSLLPLRPELSLLDRDFLHLLTMWFNRGFLQLRRISWQTPAFILEKLIAYEAVHEITSWEDLRRRLASDRRCYAFFHPQLPDEPLIFVEVALTRGLTATIGAVLEDEFPVPASPKSTEPDTAIFYSISNCQTGLRGISFGNFLIKQVVDDLAQEISTLRQFATLSPLPGFRRWLEDALASGSLAQLNAKERDILLAEISAQVPAADSHEAAREALLTRLCAHYLVNEKCDGMPLDSVARFHLENGARIERINWQADSSALRQRQSFGILVNYLYEPKVVVKQHEDYLSNGEIAMSSTIKTLLSQH